MPEALILVSVALLVVGVVLLLRGETDGGDEDRDPPTLDTRGPDDR